MSIDGISLVSIPVSDQEAAKAYYRDALGFEVVADAQFEPGRRWVQLTPPGSATSIALVTWFDAAQPGSQQGLVLGTSDIDADYELLAARGVVFRGGIQSAPWGRFAGFDDPDGNGWVLRGDA